LDTTVEFGWQRSSQAGRSRSQREGGRKRIGVGETSESLFLAIGHGRERKHTVYLEHYGKLVSPDYLWVLEGRQKKEKGRGRTGNTA